jgi:lysophospholipase L1-like esterase
MPEAVFLFIGPGDMSTLVNGNYTTYPLLPYLDKQLKQRCLANGVAYWSMFEAMGGENSMQYWVEQELASTDYTHFSPKGSRIISELFFNALYLDLSR